MARPAQISSDLLLYIERLQGEYGYPDVPSFLILAQSALETGNFTSRRVVEDNNAFGMMFPRSRPTTAIAQAPPEPGQPGAFAAYADLEDSVKDYFLRQRYFQVPNTGDPVSYVNATVATGYAEGGRYADAWLDHYMELGEGGGPVVVNEPTTAEAGFPFGVALLALAALSASWN